MIGVGLYGRNGHQIGHKLVDHPAAKLVAVAKHEVGMLPEPLRAGVTVYETRDELFRDERVQLVSLCAPRRADQADDAIAALRAGKHVYAEKPCALTEAKLDAILQTSRETRCHFHEMADSALHQPYLAMRKLVRDGVVGEVVQVFAQKSYPLSIEHRPQDEAIDGGLTCQAGVHALRMIEHVTGVAIEEISCIETTLGNPRANDDGNLRIATSMMMRLKNGALATATANYLNPIGFGSWGNETLRIFGTNGMLEATDGAMRTRLVVGEKDHGTIDASAPGRDFFDAYVAMLEGKGELPFRSIEEELHPTRMVIRAKSRAVLAVSQA